MTLEECVITTTQGGYIKRLNPNFLVITCGGDGMYLFYEGMRHIPVASKEKAVDVSGAGDTVVAALTLSLTAGAT